jgi:hypothetical protein
VVSSIDARPARGCPRRSAGEAPTTRRA